MLILVNTCAHTCYLLLEVNFNFSREFYSKMGDLRNSIVYLGKPISDVKLIRKILRSLPERFIIKVTTIKEGKDLEGMKIEELVGSLQNI